MKIITKSINYFFTSDTHFNHKNIIKYCNRPFLDVFEMNEALIQNWNSVVKSNDEIYHLGDFALSQNYNTYSDRLNGKIHLILGNHDNRQLAFKTFNGRIFETYQLNINGTIIFLSHYPHRVWIKRHRGSFHLFGHCHGKVASLGKSFDIGIDCNNYTPLSYEQIINKMKTLPIY